MREPAHLFPAMPSLRRLLPSALGLLALGLGAGCSGPGPLLGRWEGIDSEQGTQTFVFERGGKAHWIIEYQGKSQTFDVRYKLDRTPTPHHLDLTDFGAGPLAGQALYCLAEVTADELRIDCRPGEPGAAGAASRPKAWSDQAVRCRRVKV